MTWASADVRSEFASLSVHSVEASTALMLSRGMTLAGLAIVIGVVASFALTRLLTSVLHETRPNDPAILILSGSGLGIVALSAGDFAVRRISSVEPMDVLRRE
jgi:putative ABC transport system permease protein